MKVLLCLMYDVRGCLDASVNLTAMSPGDSAHVRGALVGSVVEKISDKAAASLTDY
jgi:hypothetical protein